MGAVGTQAHVKRAPAGQKLDDDRRGYGRATAVGALIFDGLDRGQRPLLGRGPA